MGQNINILSTSNIIKDDVARHNENIATLRSQFGGTSFPSSPTVGQPCWRTDLGLGTVAGTTGKLYFFSGDTDIGSAGWITSEETSVYTAEITNARGSKATLDQRLDISLNEDGTLKSGVAAYQSEWILPALTFTYLSAITFKTDGNTTDIYLQTRRLKVNLGASVFKTEVVSAVYSGGGDETTVTIADASLDNTLVSVEHSIISPIADDGALTAKMIKAANEEIDLSVDLNVVSDGNYTLTDAENLYGRMELTTSHFTVARDIITDNVEHTFLFVNNEAFNVTVKTSAGTGVVVPVGESRLLRNDTVNVINYEASTNYIDTSSTAQTKIGDLTIGESVAVASWSFSGTTITINTSAIHNLIVGKYFNVLGLVATTNAPNGRWVVASVVDTDTITFTAVDTPTGTPTVSSATLEHGDIVSYGLLNTKNNVKIVDFGTAVNNNRYVVDNPFGNNTHVITRVEFLNNGVWIAVEGMNQISTSAAVAYGATSGAVLGEGIVVQTAITGILITNASQNAQTKNATALITSASCRVIVTYIGEAKDA